MDEKRLARAAGPTALPQPAPAPDPDGVLHKSGLRAYQAFWQLRQQPVRAGGDDRRRIGFSQFRFGG